MTRRIHALPLALSLALALTTAAPLAAQQHPSNERGFDPAKVYQFGDLDSVNLLNGNLGVSIPIGPAYPIGGSLSYGLTLVYNSKVWDFVEAPYQGLLKSKALPDRLSNAGVGWTLSLGRLLDPADPVNDYEGDPWVYVGPDGSQHLFYTSLGTNGSTNCTPTNTTCYTRDSSYIRMKALTSALRVLEFPDGTYHTFVKVGTTTEWRIINIRDRFDEVPWVRDLDVTYSTDGLTWTLTDKHGRVQKVIFEPDPSLRYPRRLKKIELTSFAGTSPAVYQFSYPLISPSLRVTCASTYPNWNYVKVPLLSSITLPDGSSFGLTYNHPTDGGDCRARGALKSLTLPTGGTIEYTYRLHTLPIMGCSYREWHSYSAAIATRRFRDAAGADLGAWTYSSQLSASPATSPYSCDGRAFVPPAEQVAVTVITPLKDKTVSYFSVWPGAEFTVATAFHRDDYGLPFSKLPAPDGSGTRFLSTEVFDWDEQTSKYDLVRSSYVRYERDGASSCSLLFTPHCMNTNRRLASDRSVFHDDGGKYAESTSTGFDGAGHYRTVTTGGTIGAGDVRTVFTDYHALPTSTANWVLGTFKEQTVTEGGVTAKIETCFDTNTGFLARRRIYKSGTGKNGSDVVEAFTPDGAGNLAREESYGGDGAGLSTSAAICSLGLGTNRYRVDHDYQAGSLQRSRYIDQDGGQALVAVDRVIDTGSGLPSSDTDAAGLTTGLEYDAMGRLTWVKPPAGHGGWTQFVYTPGSAANVLVRRRANGSKTAAILSQSQVFFDSFGRVWKEDEKMPDGTWNVRETFYDGMGHRASVSEIQTGTPNKKTEFLGYDPFGRPTTVRPATGSGQDVTLSYQGMRAVTRSFKVGTTYNAGSGTVTQTSVDVIEEIDRQGRLWKVTEPAGPIGELQTTRYEYDVGGRLKRVCVPAGACSQERLFTYDNRGFLTSEKHPEKGTSGNGTVTYSGYDPRGHVGRIVDGPNDLAYTWDRAERLLQVAEGSGAQRTLKTFTYGTTSTSGNWKKGKLERAERFNYVTIGTTPFTIEVEDAYTYGGIDGRPSRRDTKVYVNGPQTDGFFQTFGHDALGDLVSQAYPQCTLCGNASPRTVSYTRTEGRLTAVPGYASSITYHPNGLVNKVFHTNGVTDTQANDPNSIRRPFSHSAAKGAATLWSSGNYGYDGAGNVTKMGTAWFEYWKGSRIKTGTLLDGSTGGGTQKKQSYTYDGYGNILSITTQVGTGTPVVRNTPTSASTNRLTGAVAYDAAGNLTSWNGASYIYGPFNEMWHMTSGTEDWLYLYNAADERVWGFKVGANFSRWTLRDLGNRVVREYANNAGTWSVERDYVYRDGSLLAAETPAGVRHFSLDHLGTPRLITNSAGTQLAYHAYYPFGEEATSPTLDTERLKFTGHERDLNATTGSNPGGDDLDYMHARFCSPLTGRFLSVDPSVRNFRLALPQSWNRYAYVLNNPLKLVDPDGEVTQLVIGGATESNFFGHIAIAIDDKAYSFGTTYVDETGDWGVSLESYLDAQGGRRATTILTLDVSPEQEQKLKTWLTSNSPDIKTYSPPANTCVTTCEKALEVAGVLPNVPGPVVVDQAGNEMQAGSEASLTPGGLKSQVERAGLVKSSSTQGQEVSSKAKSFWNTLVGAIRRLRQ